MPLQLCTGARALSSRRLRLPAAVSSKIIAAAFQLSSFPAVAYSCIHAESCVCRYDEPIINEGAIKALKVGACAQRRAGSVYSSPGVAIPASVCPPPAA